MIAAHLERVERHEIIQYALRSVSNQTEKPDKVLISYSGTKADEDRWRVILRDIETIILFCEEKQPQFRHLSYLEKYVEDDDVVMFLDDDDMYHEKKVEITKQFMVGITTSVFHTWTGFYTEPSHYYTITTPLEAEKYVNVIRDTREFWATAVRGKCFKLFFTHHPKLTTSFEETMEVWKGQVDLIFNICIVKDDLDPIIKTPLYYHRHPWIEKDYESYI